MGFTWAQSSEALKTHATLEEAVESLFGGDCNPGPGGKRLKMFLKAAEMTRHFSIEFSDCLFVGSLQNSVPVRTSQINQWSRKKWRMWESGSSDKQAVPERCRSETLMLWTKTDQNLSHRPLVQEIL